jgi:hypothetical protein
MGAIWEYHTEIIRVENDDELPLKLRAALDHAGKFGWELVSLVPVTPSSNRWLAVFKQPKG